MLSLREADCGEGAAAALTVGMSGIVRAIQCGQEVEDEERRQFEVAALDRFKLAGKVGVDSNELFSYAFANELLEMIERVPASSCNQVVKSCLSQTFIVMSNAFADAVP